jgi:polyhydroxybutyrate depolymerase
MALAMFAFMVSCGAPDENWNGFPVPCDDGQLADCQMRALSSGGDERQYMVVGEGACGTETLPLILVWHGSGTNGEYARLRIAPTGIDDGPALVVYPFGLKRPELDDRTGWNRDPKGNDVDFFDSLIEALVEESCIDPNRVFSIGHSRGGRFSDVLGCFRGDDHRALATIGAGTGNVESCDDQAPMWITHGRKDEYVGFWEGEDRRNFWAKQNGCEVPGLSAFFDDDKCHLLPGCDADKEVIWCPHTATFEAGHGPPPFAEEEIGVFFARFLP